MHVRWLILLVMTAVVLGSAGVQGDVRAAVARPDVALNACTTGTLPSGSEFKVCPPAGVPNGLVIWVHGYVVKADPLGFQDGAQGSLPDLPTLITGLGFVYAAPSYRANGLVVQEAKADILELLTAIYTQTPTLKALPVFLIGASMGGLIATQLAETNPKLVDTDPQGAFTGALAICGIVGDFRREITYWGNYNALFHTLFSPLVASWGTAQPNSTTTSAAWVSTYKQSIFTAISNNPTQAAALIATSRAPVDSTNLSVTAANSIEQLAYFSMLSADNAAVQLLGNPFENSTYWYSGTGTAATDWALNLSVPRSRASSAAVQAMAAYETTGQPKIPMVVMHTSLDPVVPVDQTLLYMQKLANASNTTASTLLVNSYGHCNFTQQQLTEGFSLLLSKVTGQPFTVTPSIFMTDTQVATTRQSFQQTEAAEAAVQAQYKFTRTYMPSINR